MDRDPVYRQKSPSCPLCKPYLSQKDRDVIITYRLREVFKAIEAKDLESVKLLIQNHLTIGGEIYNFKSEYGNMVHYTPLRHAILRNSKPIVKELLKSGDIDVNKIDKDGNTPLHLAASSSDPLFLKLLLKYTKIIKDSKNRKGKTPFFTSSWLYGVPWAGIERLNSNPLGMY